MSRQAKRNFFAPTEYHQIGKYTISKIHCHKILKVMLIVAKKKYSMLLFYHKNKKTHNKIMVFNGKFQINFDI
jgi:hypothetical protein